MNYLDLVNDFHRTFRYRQPTPCAPDFSCKETNVLRSRLLREELMELRDAAKANDRVEILDALCDSQYVLSGAILAWGLRGMFEVMTPPHANRKITDLPKCFHFMEYCISEMEECANQGYGAQVITFSLWYQSDLLRLIRHFGFLEVFDAAFANVHASNLSKLWSEEEMQDQIRNATRDDIARFEQTEGGYIAWRADRKIVKPGSFVKPSLSQFVK